MVFLNCFDDKRMMYVIIIILFLQQVRIAVNLISTLQPGLIDKIY